PIGRSANPSALPLHSYSRCVSSRCTTPLYTDSLGFGTSLRARIGVQSMYAHMPCAGTWNSGTRLGLGDGTGDRDGRGVDARWLGRRLGPGDGVDAGLGVTTTGSYGGSVVAGAVGLGRAVGWWSELAYRIARVVP